MSSRVGLFLGSFSMIPALLFGSKFMMIFFLLSSVVGDAFGSVTGLRYLSGQFICTSGLTAALNTTSSVSASATFASAEMLAVANEASDLGICYAVEDRNDVVPDCISVTFSWW